MSETMCWAIDPVEGLSWHEAGAPAVRHFDLNVHVEILRSVWFQRPNQPVKIKSLSQNLLVGQPLSAVPFLHSRGRLCHILG